MSRIESSTNYDRSLQEMAEAEGMFVKPAGKKHPKGVTLYPNEIFDLHAEARATSEGMPEKKTKH